MDRSDSVDYNVTNKDIQSLSDHEALVDFFAHISYNTKSRITQTPTNLGITAESIRRQIKRIERIANQDEFLQVYLFEVDSVTTSLTRDLVRQFRDLMGYFLIVITSDYERVDFVLVEKSNPIIEDESGSLSQPRKVDARPRILTIDRRKPTRVQCRVLNRFPYTEQDPFAQYEKLLSAYNVADWSEEFFNNHALFSDYYLLERLQDSNEWKEDATPTYRQMCEILSNFRYESTDNRLHSQFISQIFKALGFKFVGSETRKEINDPNYRLYSNDGNETKPLTLALTYPWNRSLDGADEQRDPSNPSENPGKAVVSILEKGESDWVIVTNGKLWRLYSRKTHSRAANYYEIDLEGGTISS